MRTIDRYGGTHLHTSRTNPARVAEGAMPDFLKGRFPFTGERRTADCTPHVLRALEHLRIDTLVPIGGDDTLSFGVRLQPGGGARCWPSPRRWTTTSSGRTTASASPPP